MRVATRSRKARSWVMTIDAGTLQQQLLQPLDAVDVEVIGRLVEQQQVGLQRERQGERAALALAAGAASTDPIAPSSPKRCRNSTSRASARQRSRSSWICSRWPRSARLSRSVERGRQLGLLLDERDRQAVARLDLAVVERRRARR